jgi:hypothetical protein
LNQGIWSQTQSTLKRITERLRRHVVTPAFQRSLEMLDDHGCVIISGMPGIGKSTLAEALFIHHLEAGCEGVCITSEISEAWATLSTENRKQVFYYDDFLGRTAFRPELGKNEDRSLAAFIDHCRRTESNARLLMTTREYILRDALRLYERLDHEDFGLNKVILALEDYTKRIRARIVFNHLYFSDFPLEHQLALIRSKHYLEMVNHKGFNPRLIEMTTSPGPLLGGTTKELPPPEAFPEHVARGLNNPEQLWSHVYDHQIDDTERSLVFCLATLPSKGCRLSEAQDMAATRERALGRSCTPSQVLQAIRRVDGSLLMSRRGAGKVTLDVTSPSVSDFIESRGGAGSGLDLCLCGAIL